MSPRAAAAFACLRKAPSGPALQSSIGTTSGSAAVAVAPLDPAWVLSVGRLAQAAYAALPAADDAVRLDRDETFGGIAEAAAVPEVAVSVGELVPAVPATPPAGAGARYAAAGDDAPVEVAAGFGALAPGAAVLTMAGVPAFRVARSADATLSTAPAFGPLRETLGVADVRLAYARLLGASATAVDPLVVPMELWNAGPLGALRKQANAAAARGDKAAFGELAARYWALFNAAVERRRVLGAGTGGRKGQP